MKRFFIYQKLKELKITQKLLRVFWRLCLLTILVWILFPITEVLSKKFGEVIYKNIFNIPYFIRLGIDSIILLIVVLALIKFMSIKKYRIDNDFLKGLFFACNGIVLWWLYERFINDRIYFYSIYNSDIAYFDIFIGIITIFFFISLFKYFKNIRTPKSRQRKNTFIFDAPKEKIKEDCLSRGTLAENLATEILLLDTIKGSRSLAITSDWGNGKTTFLNFVKERLNGKIEILSMTPWSINPGKSITTFFFQEIIKKFGSINHSIAKKIKEYAYLLEAIDLGWFAKSIKVADLATLAQLISNQLIKCDIKVLIIFDDIDRLSAPEIEEVFRIIRGSANFSNFIFLCAFDKRYVQSALRNSNPAYNEHYIEKFFESEFTLPELRKEKLHKVILDNIDWLEEDDRKSFEAYVQINQFISSDPPVFHLFTNLRSIYRWLNGIHSRYEILKGECEIGNLADLEMLSLLFPEVYSLLSKDYEQYLYTDRYTSNYQLWNSKMSISKEENYLLYLNQRNMRDLKDYCIEKLEYDDYKIRDMMTILNRLVPTTNNINDLTKKFSNPNYIKRYFNGILESTEISDKKFNELIKKGKDEIQKFIDEDVDNQYSHALFLQCLKKSRLSEFLGDTIIENIIFTIIHGTIHYEQIMLHSYDLVRLINKLSYEDSLKKTYIRTLISNEPFSFSLLIQFSPIHENGTNDFTLIFTKEESDNIIAEMLTKAINENRSFSSIAEYYFYTKTKKTEFDTNSCNRKNAYISLNDKTNDLYKKYLAENFISQTPHYIWHSHPHEELVYPSEYFTEFWESFDDFLKYYKELGLFDNLSQTESRILEEYKLFMEQWSESGKMPIKFKFSSIKI